MLGYRGLSAKKGKAMLAALTCLIGTMSLMAHGNPDRVPEQIHIALGETMNQMTVMWSTWLPTKKSIVEYGTASVGMVLNSSGSWQTLNNRLSIQYIHTVKLDDLTPSTKYFYRCGDGETWSTVYSFSTLKNDTDWKPRFIIYGDLGYREAVSVKQLRSEAINATVDVILHNGDIAYDLHTDNGRVGDNFMNLIEPIAARVPYMVSVGNHEAFNWNYTNYRTRFRMPGTPDNLWYSFKVGPVHFVIISTEVYFFLLYGGMEAVQTHYNWMEDTLKSNLGSLIFNEDHNWKVSLIAKPQLKRIIQRKATAETQHGDSWFASCLGSGDPMVRTDLVIDHHHKEANEPENRKRWPWIITLGHRPMYCSNTALRYCRLETNPVRIGFLRRYAMEDLLYKYGVDLAFWGHNHCYERLWPTVYGEVFNGSSADPYNNPRGPVHITSGVAGNQEGTSSFRGNRQPWSAFGSTERGYTRLVPHNSTHLYFEQVSADRGGDVIDRVWIVKEKHGSYSKMFPGDKKKVKSKRKSRLLRLLEPLKFLRQARSGRRRSLKLFAE